MAFLQSSLDKLTAECNSLDVHIQKHEHALSPLRRMPTEILSLIFTFTMPPHHPCAESGPWLVSAVCARWRTITLSQPLLWTVIDNSERRTSSFKLKIQLDRSRDLPLNVTFICEDVEICTKHEVEMLDILAQHSVRWETVTLSGPEAFYSGIRNQIQRQFPILLKLDISMFRRKIPASLDIFECAPKLQEVFVNRDYWAHPVSMTLPSQLSRYGGCNTWNGHLATLSSCSHLVDCTLDMGNDKEFTHTGAPILLPHLLRLFLSHHGFLTCIETPALVELYCDYDLNSTHHDLPSFFRRLACKLETLIMTSGFGDDVSDLPNPDFNRLADILRAAPSMKCFGFISTPSLPAASVGEFLRSARVAPALESLALSLGGENVLYDLVEAVETTDWESGRLRSFTLSSPQCLPSSDTAYRMEALRGRGMDILVVSTYYGLYEKMVPQTLRIER
ncbi:hypothetical protein DFH07DRAFT_812680 [Mycena maculata]|uniref:F-box domain-containing protein n=1 Tax=Mycena maculata TaxID=230809 RepID=A0AAD7NJG2_9AGAR|nr:hypothetical protein DFH07DRAFT_812680 [Mycena maculata]